MSAPRVALAVCLAAVGMLPVGPVSAATKIVVTTKTYEIAGDDGMALLEQMDKKGPKQGLMTRAIAQTTYTVDWQLTVEQDGRACRLTAANGTLNLTYTFPKVVSAMSPALASRWRRFLAGVYKHERTHGRIATEMVHAAEKAATGITYPEDGWCLRTKREARKRIDAIYDQYEAEQVAFDVREHGEGGNVQALVSGLTRQKITQRR
jgi:predicted secreted Zn-dependent protease